MYCYEDRIRAVELYIKLGKRTSPTIRQLGYPTKNALKGWYREYQQRLDLPVGYARRELKFSQVQKVAAIEHYSSWVFPETLCQRVLTVDDIVNTNSIY